MANWESRIRRVTDHVRGHLNAELDVDALARVAHASPYHFARIFKAIQGESPARFVRRARLERAVTLMRTRPELELGEIATQVGLGSPSHFSRTFKQVYGVAPSAWDRATRLNPGVEGYEDQLALLRPHAPAFTPRLVRHAAMRFASVRVRTPFLDQELLARGYDELTGWFDHHGVDWQSQPLIGLSWDNPDSTPLDQIWYDLGFELPDGLTATGAVTEQVLPEIQSVDVHVQGPLGFIALAWEHLYEHWLPTARSEPANLPGIKRFRRRPDQLGWDEFDLDCSIALRAQ